MKLLIFVFLINGLAFASDCTLDKITIKEGESVSLYDKGKSLENNPIQDQDGVGSCYANSTSIMLKASLPSHPDISYLDIALKNGTSGWWSDWKENEINRFTKTLPNNGVTTLADAGTLCSAMAAIEKNGGGVCPSQYFSFESQSRRLEADDTYIQQNALLSLAKHFDKYYAETEKDNINATKAFNDIKNLLIGYEKQFTLECEKKILSGESKIIDFRERSAQSLSWIGGWASYYLSEDYKKEEGHSENVIRCAGLGLKFLNSQIINPYSIEESFQYEPTPDFKKGFLERLKVENVNIDNILSNKTTYQLNDFYNPDQYKQSLIEALKVDKIFQSYLKDTYQAFVRTNNEGVDLCKDVDFIPLTVEPYEGDYSSQLILADIAYSRGNVESCKKYEMLNFLSEKKNHDLIHTNLNCSELIDVHSYLSSTFNLYRLGQDMDGITELLSPKEKPSIQTIENILAPHCAENLISVNHLSCEEFKPDLSSAIALTNFKSVIQRETSAEIAAGRPIAISMCTHVFDNPELDTNFCEILPESKDRGMHQMTITGYRCNQGMIEYELVNSWGKSCPMASYEQGYKNSAFECILDESEFPTGKFWVKENAMAKNLNRIEKLSKKPDSPNK